MRRSPIMPIVAHGDCAKFMCASANSGLDMCLSGHWSKPTKKERPSLQAYSDPKRENDPHALPDLEVFSADWAQRCTNCGTLALDGADDGAAECDCPEGTSKWEDEPGFYWWHCLPGCLPDSDPVGPFDTPEEALTDAR